MSRQSPTKAQAKITELWWEPTIATAAARSGTDETGLYRPLVECSLEVALERCCAGSQGRPERDVPQLTHLLWDVPRIFAEGGDESAPDTLPFGCRVDGIQNGR
jgi:hypothetical protein